MVDLQIIEIRDLLTVKRFKIAQGVVPRSIEVFGIDLRSVREVRINETRSPSVVVISNNRLLAQVPEQIVAIRSLVAISNKLTNTKRSMIQFKLGDTTSFTSGLERLVQVFLKILLQTPGTDAFNPLLGGGVLAAAGKLSQNPSNASSVAADVSQGVDRTRKQLIAIQAHDPALAVSEKLLYARLLDAHFTPQEQVLACQMDIANHAMKSSLTSLEV